MPDVNRSGLSRQLSLWVSHYSLRHAIGWQGRPDRAGGACFAVVRLGDRAGIRPVRRFPMTGPGWQQAWSDLVSRDPVAAQRIVEILAEQDADEERRAEKARLDAGSLVVMRSVIFLGGYLPAQELGRGSGYDVRFLEDRVSIYFPLRTDPAFELPYRAIEIADIGGPEMISAGGGSLSITSTAEAKAIAAVLTAVTASVTGATVLRFLATDSELFLLNTTLAPDLVRAGLARPLSLIRPDRPGS